VETSHRHRRPRKVRRTGRHAKPSQVHNVAETAGKAAPALAIAGALIAASQAHVAVKTPARAAAVVEQVRTAGKLPARPTPIVEPVYTDALVTHHEQVRCYTVQPGDTLSSIAQRFYGNPADWHWLYQVNRSVVQNPNVIYPGEVLTIPHEPPASGMASAPSRPTVLTSSTTLSGTLGCPQLEELWEQAGGSGAEAVTAASIAMAESSGEQFATGAAGERGYWQINPDHGSLSTYDPLGNAQAAVIISDDGTNWTPWTTFTSGAYLGRC